MSIDVKQLANGVKRYASAIRLMLHEGFGTAKWSVILTVVFDLLTLMSQAGALGILAQIPRYISRNNANETQSVLDTEGSSQSLNGWSFAEIEDYFFSMSPDIFIPIVIGSSFLALLFTTVSTYFATYCGRKSARMYHEKIVSECYRTISRSDFWRFGSQQANIKDIHFNLVQYSIHVSQAFERLIRLTPVLIALPTGAYVAFLLQPLATSILFVLAFILVPGTLLIGRRIHANASSFFDLEAVNFNGALTKSLHRNFYQALPFEVSSTDTKLELIDRPFKSFLKSYDLLQLSSAQMLLVTGIVRAIIFFAVLIILYLIVYQNNNFAAVAVYGTILYIILNTVQSAISVIANLNVYAPQVFKYIRLRNKIYAAPQETDTTNEYVSSLHEKNILLVDVISKEPFTRAGYNGYLPYLTSHFDKGLSAEEIFVFPTANAIEVDKYSYNELGNLFEEKTGLAFGSFIGKWDHAEQIEEWLGNTDERRDKPLGSLMHLQTELRFAFMMCLACIHGAKIIEIPSQHFPKLKDGQSELFDILPERFVLIRRTMPEHSISDHSHLVFLVNASTVTVVLPDKFNPEMLNELKSSGETTANVGDAISVLM